VINFECNLSNLPLHPLPLAIALQPRLRPTTNARGESRRATAKVTTSPFLFFFYFYSCLLSRRKPHLFIRADHPCDTFARAKVGRSRTARCISRPASVESKFLLPGSPPRLPGGLRLVRCNSKMQACLPNLIKHVLHSSLQTRAH